MFAYTYPILDIFWSMFVFFGFFLWIWLLITIFGDIFRSRDMGGFGKAAWFIFVLLVPLFGALMYLIVRGHSMHERQARAAEKQEAAFREYVQQAAGGGKEASAADELAKLAALADKGAITQQEFEAQKAKLLGGQPPHTTAA